ncbi:MAG: hypothetical protein GXP05_10050 [Alphaproteobacteria bacterium]|nr:hypothetical protein [Alphaproteobacteria bacterium]
MIKKIHPITGIIGFLTMLTFWTSTAYSELFGTHASVASVKMMVLNHYRLALVGFWMCFSKY